MSLRTTLSILMFFTIGAVLGQSDSHSEVLLKRLTYIYNNVNNSNADVYFSTIGYKYLWNRTETASGKISYFYIEPQNKKEFGFTRVSDTTCEAFFIIYRNQEYLNFLKYIKDIGFKYGSDKVQDEKVFIYFLRGNSEIALSKFYDYNLKKMIYKVYYSID